MHHERQTEVSETTSKKENRSCADIKKVDMGYLCCLDCQVQLVLLAEMVMTVEMAEMGRMGRGKREVIQAFTFPQVLLVQPVVEQSTPGGGRQPAQTHKELNFCMRE